MVRELRKINLYDILEDGDPNLEKWWSPRTHIYRELVNDPTLPQEVRKVLALPTTERQFADAPIVDAESS